MFIKTLTMLSVAFALSVGAIGAGTTSANAHAKKRVSIAPIAAHTNDVWVADEFAGRDPDANVRLQLRRDFGLSNL